MARLTVEIPEELHRRAKVWAAESGKKMRALVIDGLERVLSERPKAKKGGKS